LPLPLAPLVIEIHAAVLDAVHVQLLPLAVTATDPAPPVAPID